MNNEEKILAMLETMQKDMASMNQKIDSLDQKVAALREEVAELKEAHTETRSGVNRLVEWADECGYVIKFPLPKI